MQRLLYLLTYPFLWTMSQLPYRVFYGVSDFAFFILYYIIGYRKKVVADNLKNAFPEKSKEELKRIRKKFYHHFCDVFIEMTKTISISEEELKKRFVLKNPQEIERLEGLNKGFIMMLGHYNSYEWITALPLQGVTFKAYGIYKKIRNPYFDKLIRRSRGKFNSHLLSKDDVVKKMVKNKRDGVLSCYGMIADQAPKMGRSNYWRPFFGRKVPVFIGSEKMAKSLDFSVTYLKIDKVKRGFYEAELIPIADNPKEVKDYKITDKYIELLEQQIRAKPENYLWTHKRWKHVGMQSEE